MFHLSRGRSLRLIAITAAVAAAAALTGCSSGSSGGGLAEQSPDTLRIAISSPPASLDPALAGNGDPLQILYELAYDPLIYQLPDGSFAPGLATEWGFVGEGNKVFDLTLREGVTFTDGGELTAEGVKAYFEYYGSVSGFGSRVQNFESIDVTGPLSLRITLKEPNPQLAYMLTQDLGTGNVISPVALENVETLGTSTAGAGQYVLDETKTVANQTYVFTANPDYWNPDAINWETIEVKVLANTAAALSAMRTNQIDYMFGSAKEAEAAEEAGFNVTTEPYLFGFVSLLDRGGEVVPALGDLRVRQALNYAIDRDSLVSGLFGDYASPSQQLLLPGADGYDESLESAYTYDPDKARALLAEAGYADGFTIPMAAYNLQPGETDVAQAIASYWDAIGVTTEVTVAQTINDYAQMILNKEAVSTVFEYGGQPFYLVATQLLAPGFFNPFNSTDPEISALIAEGAAANSDDAPAIYKELQAEVQKEAWFAPFASIDKVVISRPGLEGIQMTPDSLNPNPVFFSAGN
ncbi:ABC transporter substrate-binding protein [Homoserinibacter sp. GY 40078]|uniref:ABC transporter substrate-binding protein n=1 Tax=Homoserinibacter sp. GY 40078 TaxID=2603275 RepID=UPI0011CB70B7|nr:ABC transporter substrate-binding protein [Homoserinibacter sp. GY 40078]TXK19305.1 ABC transporter substrate-binding protein [Homoserinibacter sp. GY 40078]